ncbi:hypothetical protein T484DRAFT_1907245 [Baffinella frigidus]|nr:hypothetical protein T484DRAFT_1907245 [Cryptophyta sp. CCMP2293]
MRADLYASSTTACAASSQFDKVLAESPARTKNAPGLEKSHCPPPGSSGMKNEGDVLPRFLPLCSGSSRHGSGVSQRSQDLLEAKAGAKEGSTVERVERLPVGAKEILERQESMGVFDLKLRTEVDANATEDDGFEEMLLAIKESKIREHLSWHQTRHTWAHSPKE